MSKSRLERIVFRQLILAVSVVSLIFLGVGIAVGFLISGQKTNASEPLLINVPASMSDSFSDVAQKVESAVVNIDTKSNVPEVTLKGDKPGGNPDDIAEFYKRQLQRPSYSIGSGFIVDKTGYILTNFHVVQDTSRITIRLQSGAEYLATIVGKDEETDLAVLKVDAGKDLPSLKLGDSNSILVGDWVLAIGSPFGLAQTVTAGIISQTRRETPFSNIKGFPNKFIQTDAAINRGNSGGPLVNMNGEVIGVNSQIATTTGDYNGIGFALPSNEASYVYQQILANGRVRRGYLGIGLETIKPEYGKVFGKPDLKGAIITSITDKEGRAARAGLLISDVITALNDQPIENGTELIEKIASSVPENEVKIDFVREVNNKLEKQTVTVKLSERPTVAQLSESEESPSRKLNPVPTKLKSNPFGVTVENLTPDKIKTSGYEAQSGVLIKEIDPTSFIADEKNPLGRGLLNEGELIQRINLVPVSDVKSFDEIAGKLKTGDAVVMHIAFYNRFTKVIQPRIVAFTIQ